MTENEKSGVTITIYKDLLMDCYRLILSTSIHTISIPLERSKDDLYSAFNINLKHTNAIWSFLNDVLDKHKEVTRGCIL